MSDRPSKEKSDWLREIADAGWSGNFAARLRECADEIDRLTKREAELAAIIGRAATAFGAPHPSDEAGKAAQAARWAARFDSLNEMLAALKE